MFEPAPNWVANRVIEPGMIWNRYADALGLDTLQLWYGSNWPPDRTRPGEYVYCIRDMDSPQPAFVSNPAAWISMTQDQFDWTNWYMSRGVFPNQHGKGLGRWLRQFAENFVRQEHGEKISIWVHVSNVEHLINVKADPYWTESAFRYDPASYGFEHEIS